MKTSCFNALAALGVSCFGFSQHAFADRVPGIVMDAALYEQRVEAGLPYLPPDPVRSPAELKMSSQLASLFNAGLRPTGVTETDMKSEMMRLGQLREWETVEQGTAYGPVDSDLLFVYVLVTGPASLNAVRPVCFGIPDEAPAWNLLAGWIEQDRLVDVASSPEVVFLQAVDPPRFRTGSVTSAGDALHHGPQARGAPLSLDGSGVPVGVISDGVSNLPLSVASLDLPPLITVLNAGSGDEGTAMLEIIHDLAPGAPLRFCAAGSNQIAFGNAIAALAQGGCKVICDDVGWYQDPFFEHSPLGQQIAALQSAYGYLHVSAAGNDAQRHHQQLFTDALPNPAGDGYHDPILFVNIPPGGVLDVFMQWKESLSSTPVSDYDLYLFDYNNPTTPIAQSMTRNRVGETIYYTNRTLSTITAAIYVYRFSGAIAHDVEIFLEPQNGAVQYTNGTSPVDAIFGHPGHGSVIATVSTDVTNPSVIEWDSSQGPFTIIGLLQPSKPDVAAADGVAVTGAGGFTTPFFGTSAAAPHVAGVLALVWSRSPGVSHGSLKNSVSLACADLGNSGFDNVFGWGRPLADQWALLLNLPPQISTPSGTFECAQMSAENIVGVTVSDPDSAANSVLVTLSATKGMVLVNVGVPGGVIPSQVTGNGSMTVTIAAPMSSIQTTFGMAGGLAYYANPVPSGTTVADFLSIFINDQGNTGIGGALATVGTVTLQAHEYAYDAWVYDHFDASQRANPAISGDSASPDDDLHGNVWEYFMGTDPWTADSAAATSGAVNGSNFVFQFRVAKSIQASSYAIKVSQDLTNWSLVPTGQITAPWQQHPTALDAWLMEVKRPLSANTRDFIRVEFDPRR